ncbi:MAG: protease modulator HflC [Hyphomonadaceae bacterium]|nr:MAG: membrane protease subunit HflC [Caulobacteraceae bacterium]MBT9444595.1 protease modulator HflC [Hyphomonadaceae bacterium]TPW03938.1 MAG: membrane protease subunit HflC [Alphaproteobacteria bacterium]
MNRFLVLVAGAAFAALVVISNTFFIVPQTKQAIVLQFGEQQTVINRWGTSQPGLYMKVPLVQSVVFFDKRNVGFTLAEQLIVGSDQERLVVDAFARYRIVDPLRFYQQATFEERGQQRLETILESALRQTLGAVRTDEIISTRRAELMHKIARQMDAEARGLGVQIIDVRIRQADLVPEVQERVFERMRTERQRVAAEIRADGERQKVFILAQANEKNQKTKGEGDARRAELFNSSFGRDPEFAGFYRSMQAYEKAIPPGTQMVVPPDGEFFRYLRDKDGAPGR